jgi:deoxyribonuclease V
VRIRVPHPWPRGVAEAAAIQAQLRRLVDFSGPGPTRPATVAGADVAYAADSDRLVAALVVLDAGTFEMIDTSVAIGRAEFPYASGFLAFRELPALVTALERLGTTPDLLVCDGHGFAHPRRFGLACHLGVLTDLPTIGVAKTPLGRYDPPATSRRSRSPLRDGADLIGYALRTQDNVKPVFVSGGHRIDLERACELVLRLSPRYRLPETTRRADQLARRHLPQSRSPRMCG